MATCSWTDFEIKTLVFAMPHVNAHVINTYDACPAHTKGYANICVYAKNAIPINFTNTHFPFKSESATVKFWARMKDDIGMNGAQGDELRFLIGDINSRSLLTKGCYNKTVTSCASRNSSAQDEEGYCIVKDALESIPFQYSFANRYSNTSQRSQLCESSRNSCSISSSQVQDKSIPELVRLLVERDLIGNPPCHPLLFTEFTENQIDFLPTYKRHKKTGNFSLVKKPPSFKPWAKDAGRLPGYADRILYKQGDQYHRTECLRYTSIGITGNDHLPVYGVFNVERVWAFGGSSTKSKTSKTTKKTRLRRGSA
jgi:hypothetical protein